MSTSEVLDELSKWNKKRFRPNDISLTRAVESLSGDNPLVEPKPGRVVSRWIVRGSLKRFWNCSLTHYPQAEQSRY